MVISIPVIAKPSTREHLVAKREARMVAKKARTKALFDMTYDAGGGARGDQGGTFFEDWKAELDVQAKVSADTIHVLIQAFIMYSCTDDVIRHI